MHARISECTVINMFYYSEVYNTCTCTLCNIHKL